jgi:hypothetical protein
MHFVAGGSQSIFFRKFEAPSYFILKHQQSDFVSAKVFKCQVG